MAKTVDEVILKAGVEGQANFDKFNDSLNNIDKNTKSTNETLKAFNVRNVSYQIQDMAVQIAGGTSAFVALGQQIPQLLGGFGVVGAVIGAVAAVAIPLLQVGLKAAGVDMRSLKERTDDLATSVKNFQAAQMANLPSLQGLGNTYGTLTGEAKKFFDIQQSILNQKANIELSASLSELASKYDYLNTFAGRAAEGNRKLFGMTFGGGLMGDIQKLDMYLKGINTEQAAELGKQLKDIDKASPEQAAATLNNVLKYLKESGLEGGKFARTFTETIEPIIKINNQILELKKNLNESAQQASALNVAMLEIQSSFIPDINQARRGFDQIRAAQLEGTMKIAQEEKKINEQTSKDGVDRSKELGAFRKRTEQEVADKIADIKKQQEETAFSANQTADAKGRQLALENNILKLNQDGKLAALDVYQYTSDNLRLQVDYENELKNINEQVRKNVITQQQARDLEQKALANKVAGEKNAYDALDQRQANYIKGLERANELDQRKLNNFNATATLSDRDRKNALDLFNIESDRLAQLKGINTIADPTERARREQQINDIFNARKDQTLKQQEAEKALTENFNAGWDRAYANYLESTKNAFEQAQQIFATVTKGIEDSFVNLAKTGKLSFKDMLMSISEQILRSQIKTLLSNLLTPSGGSSIVDGILGGAKSLLGFANGGMIPTNGPVIVGERGPEIISGAAGRIVTPNNQLGSSSSYVTYNISAVDASSFKQMIAKDPSFIHAVAMQGAKGTPGRY